MMWKMDDRWEARGIKDKEMRINGGERVNEWRDSDYSRQKKKGKKNF